MGNTSEIQNAIAFFKRCGIPYADTAAVALQEQAEREKGCNGCAHNGLYENEIEYGYPSPCTGCQRRVVDNYARKTEEK